MTKLALADIADHRAYENERDDFRQRIIALKKVRRVPVGPFVTFVFENRETIRFQIQEMARVERLVTDEAIENELAAYNPLIPEPGHLSATMFIELTSDEDLRRWLPMLAGIERSVRLRIGETTVAFTLDPAHEKQLTRADTTSAVHYVGAEIDASLVDDFVTGNLALVIDHPDYQHETLLSPETVAELATDVGGS